MIVSITNNKLFSDQCPMTGELLELEWGRRMKATAIVASVSITDIKCANKIVGEVVVVSIRYPITGDQEVMQWVKNETFIDPITEE